MHKTSHKDIYVVLVFMSVSNIYMFVFIICPKFTVMHIDKKQDDIII